MRVERPHPDIPRRTDYLTRCNNPDCGKERLDGYSEPALTYATSCVYEWDGWHSLHGDIHACSWACLAVVAADKAAGA